MLTGGLVWGVTLGSTLLIEQQTRPLPTTPLSTLEDTPISLPELAQQLADFLRLAE